MNRRFLRRASQLLFAGLLAVAAVVADAQVARNLPRGEVSGVDLQIEGRLVAYKGHPFRLSFTAFEVLGLDRLRRAPNTQVQVFASFLRDRAAATVTTDAQGRGLAVFDLPADQTSGFSVVVEARAPSRVTRRFEFGIAVQDPRVFELSLMPTPVYPGSPLHLGGTLRDRLTQRSIAGAEIVLELVGPRGPVGSSVRLTTDASGSFHRSFQLAPDAPVGSYSVGVRTTGDDPVRATVGAQVYARSAPPLLVSVAPSESLVAPRAWIELDVSVRRPDGRPVEGASVQTITREDERQRGRTDARGRVHLRYRMQSAGSGIQDEPVMVSVERGGLGSAQGGAVVRVTGEGYVGRLSFEGGRFAEALGGRAFLRVVTVDGRPAPAGVPVVFAGPRVRGGSARATTDASGVAVAELAIGPAPSGDESSDSCGGTTATEIAATIGEGTRLGHARRCLLVDPDGVLRVRTGSPRARPGAALPIHVDRVASVARAPVVLELVDLDGAGGHGAILATTTLAAGASEGSIAVPADVAGLLALRARVLQGADGLELRGASNVVLVAPDAPFAIDARFDRERSIVTVGFEGEPSDEVSLWALAVPYDQALTITRGYDLASQLVGLPRNTADDVARGESWLLASLGDAVPSDLVAAHALVEDVVTPQPGPESPEEEGRLRDPYRARARFVQGRLGLLFRALEAFVERSVPGDEADVAHLVNGRFQFNDAVLSAVASEGELGAEGATGLGGAPITIAQLRAIEPTFDYDAVARRVTRRRLFKLLLEMRSYVSSHGFDLAWARPGDPRVWLERMVEEGGGNYGDSLEPKNLVDGWGRPFQLVATTRPRFQLLQPVVGFELVSAGPDGRYGNGDDVFDPTARVLAQNGTYAAAVMEDALVARLRGVELSRATLGQVADLFGVYVSGVPSYDAVAEASALADPSAAFPPILEVDPDPLAIRRVGATVPSALVGPVARTSGDATIPIELGTEPRSWGIFVFAITRSGAVQQTLVRATTGTGVLAHGELPARVTEDEPLTVDLAVTNVSSSDRTFDLRATGCEGMRVELPASLAIAAEVSAPLRATLRGSVVRACPVRVDVLDGERVVAGLERTIDVTSGLHPQRRRASALVASEASPLDLAAPSGAVRVNARVTVADPSAIVELPELADVRRRDPSLVAWARVASGRPFDDGLRDDVLRAFEDPSRRPNSLSRALAVVALSARVDDERARGLRDRLIAELGSVGSDAVTASDGASGHRRMVAATIAALALSGVPDPDSDASSDPLSATFRRLLPQLRASVRAEVASPVELAFPAAALLLADAHDGHGRALFERVYAVSTRGGALRRVASAEGHEPTEGLAATVAMAIAARELGREADALAFARAAFTDLAAIGRAADDVPFWAAALSVYGTLANDEVPEVEVTIDGRSERRRLEDGRASFPVSIDGGERASITVRALAGALVVAESEVAYETPFVAETSGPLTLALQGDPGRAYGVAALELSLSASEPVFEPIVELALPAAVEADAALEQALRASPAVRGVEFRRAGFVRLALAPMGAGSTLTVALPLSFRALGSVSGLAASAYPRTETYRRTVLPARTITLAGE